MSDYETPKLSNRRGAKPGAKIATAVMPDEDPLDADYRQILAELNGGMTSPIGGTRRIILRRPPPEAP